VTEDGVIPWLALIVLAGAFLVCLVLIEKVKARIRRREYMRRFWTERKRRGLR
jgi:hypothetical protein